MSTSSKREIGWQKDPVILDTLERCRFFHQYQGNEFERQLYSNVYDSCSGSGYSSSNLENICLWFVPRVRLYRQQFRENMAWTRNSPTVASIEASVDQNANDQLEKIIRSSVAIRARFLYIFFLEWDGFVIDMNHSVNFWSMDFSLMRPQLKIWQIFEFALIVWPSVNA